MFFDARLPKNRRAMGIEAHAQPVHHHLARAPLNALWRGVVRRERVPIGDEKVATIILLES
jgi:hypothetical protein